MSSRYLFDIARCPAIIVMVLLQADSMLWSCRCTQAVLLQHASRTQYSPIQPTHLLHVLTTANLGYSVCRTQFVLQCVSKCTQRTQRHSLTQSCHIHMAREMIDHDDYDEKKTRKLSKTDKPARYAFISSTLSFHARHILPTSKLQHSYSCILLIFYKHQ